MKYILVVLVIIALCDKADASECFDVKTGIMAWDGPQGGGKYRYYEDQNGKKYISDSGYLEYGKYATSEEKAKDSIMKRYEIKKADKKFSLCEIKKLKIEYKEK